MLNKATKEIVKLINKINNHYASSAENFRSYVNIKDHEMKGIKKKHCFVVIQGHAGKIFSINCDFH
jgi:hypothetical protein